MASARKDRQIAYKDFYISALSRISGSPMEENAEIVDLMWDSSPAFLEALSREIDKARARHLEKISPPRMPCGTG